MIDEKDRKILEILEINGRESIQKLSALTMMPPSTIHNRLKRMENTKVIEGYSVKLNEKINLAELRESIRYYYDKTNNYNNCNYKIILIYNLLF